MNETTKPRPVRTFQQSARDHFAFKVQTALLMSLLLSSICFADPPSTAPAAKIPVSLPADFTSRQVSLSYEHAPMAAIIADLAKQSGYSIVVNDEPRDDQADLEFKGSLKDALDKVADACDYTWKVGKTNAILMTKRFSRQKEYPSLNAQEMYLTTQDVLATLNSFGFDSQVKGDGMALILAAYASLTPEQQADLRAGKSIPIAQLSDVQRQRMQDVVLCNLLIPQQSLWTILAAQTQTLAGATPASYARLCYEQRSTKPTPASSEIGEQFASRPLFMESFEYVVVNKRAEEKAIMLSGYGFRTAAERALRNAISKENKNTSASLQPSRPVRQAVPSPLSASTDKAEASPQGLLTPVHLHLRATTLKAVMQALCAQTGLQIETEGYLEDRKLVLELDNVTAQDALDTLAELNDWRWFSRDKSAVLLTRKRVRIPQTLDELPACMSAALPADYRAFLGVGVTTKDLPERLSLNNSGKPEVQRNLGPEPLVRESRIRARMGSLKRDLPQSLRLTLLAELDDQKRAELDGGKPLLWKNLTPAQRTGLSEAALLFWLDYACDGSIMLLNDGLRPYQSDLASAYIRLHNGNGFEVGASKNGIYSGTGAAIPGLKPAVPTRPIPTPSVQP